MALISEAGRDVLRRLLAKDPELRPSAEDILAHGWFKEDISETPLSKAHLESISKFKEYSILQKASLLFIANNFSSEQEKQQMLEEFNKIDVNKDGKLSR